MNTKSSILTLIVIAIIAIGSSVLFKPTINVGVSPTPVTVNVPEQKAPVVNVSPQLRSPEIKVNVPEQSSKVGAVSSPDLYSDYLNVNGISTFYFTQGLQTATTTPCMFKTPNATTSINFSSITFTTSTSTAFTVYPMKNSINGGLYAGATSTLGTPVSFASGVIGSAVYNASTTQSTVLNGILPPNSYFGWGLLGISLPSDTTKLRGTCQVMLRAL